MGKAAIKRFCVGDVALTGIMAVTASGATPTRNLRIIEAEDISFYHHLLASRQIAFVLRSRWRQHSVIFADTFIQFTDELV